VRSVLLEVERSLRRALDLDPRLFAAADGLAVHLAAQERWPEARAVVEGQVEALTDPSPALGRLAWLTRAEGNKDSARAEMVEVVQKFPLYRWGWWQLLDWLEEDEAWEQSRTVLAEVHPAAAADPLFTARRLTLLELAGTPRDQLDPQWERALHDFPDLLELHLRRVDLLLARQEWDAAAALVAAQERFHADATFLLARKVQALAGGGRREEALAAARTLWQLPGDTERWPEEAAWTALAHAGLTRQAALEAWDLVAGGSPLRLRAFELLLDHLGELPSAPVRRGALLAGASKRRLLMLADLLATNPGEDGRRLAATLERLGDTGGRRLALRFWRRHLDLCRSTTPVWQKIGYLLTGAGPRGLKSLRRWMADWREHPDVEMWARANYSLSLRALPGPTAPGEDLVELEAVSLAALERPHDVTVRHHACVACETALRSGDDAELLRRIRDLEPALSGDDPQLWMWNRYSWAPGTFLLFGELLGSGGPETTVELGRQLARCLTSATPAWVVREWLRRAGPQLSAGQRLGLRLRLAWARMVR
jgi:tetratricopeptide (TPR) repeat protein